MAGYFTVSGSVSGTTVIATVRGHDGYKGTVDLFYSSPTNPPPLSITPTSDEVYVPKDGSASKSCQIGLNAGQTVEIDILGSDGVQTDSASVTVTG